MSTPTRGNKLVVNAENALIDYWDIESLANVFTVAVFKPYENHLDVFFLVEPGCALDQQMKSEGFNGQTAGDAIVKANPAFLPDRDGNPRSIQFWPLAGQESAEYLARLMGLSDADLVNDKRSNSSYPDEFRPVCDTDPDYDPTTKHPYRAGYNSFNYDTTLTSIFLSLAMQHRYAGNTTEYCPPKPSQLRMYNDEMFDPEFIDYMPRVLSRGSISNGEGWNALANKIRSAMISSGRHLDVARLNEKQARVALKRLLGMLGYQILESDKLGGHNATVETLEQLYDLLAYNASDVINLEKLFKHPLYSGAFDLKKGLMDEYPETIYEAKRGTHTPDVKPWRVRRNRLTPDSSSAKFVGLVLSPYGNLHDIKTVSYMYPHARVAKERGIPQVDVLEESRKFFYENIADPDARAQFDLVYDYYASIRGKNFNESETYANDYQGADGRLPKELVPLSLSDMPKSANNLPYFHADGTPSSCFATFSTGGIHGAEADIDSYLADKAAYDRDVEDLQAAKDAYPDPRELIAEAKSQAGQIELPIGVVIDYRLVLTGVTTGRPAYKSVTKNTTEEAEAMIDLARSCFPDPADLFDLIDLKKTTMVLPNGRVIDWNKTLAVKTLSGAKYRDEPSRHKPTLFVEKPDGSTKLHPKYAYTSIDAVIHEDFASYYPLLLTNMSAFYNPELGEDRYLKIYHQKSSLGKEMKRKNITPTEKFALGVLRNGTKLILNSASGAGDAGHDTPIRMNNTIISMRIIGQLFSWRIGQAQTLAGARIVSTNTDGLYSALDEETNNRILDEQAKIINVDIEPEPMLLVSKDSNNRLEIARTGAFPWQTKVEVASGASLACHRGPTPDKSLAHPALIDHVQAEYLRLIASEVTMPWMDHPLSIREEFDLRTGELIIKELMKNGPSPEIAKMFQNVIAASNGSITYPFAFDVRYADDGTVIAHDAKVDAVDEMGHPILDTNGEPVSESVEHRNPRALQHYNRVFVVKPGTEGAVHLMNAGAWKVPATVATRRHRDGAAPRVIEKAAADILFSNGLAVDTVTATRMRMSQLPTDQDVAVRKISGIDPTWPMMVINKDLFCMSPEEMSNLVEAIDIDVYVRMAADGFESNWRVRDVSDQLAQASDVDNETD